MASAGRRRTKVPTRLSPTADSGFASVKPRQLLGQQIALGSLPTMWLLTAPLYLLAVGTAIGPLAALLPLDLQPKVAVPVGIALIWLGHALWSERRREDTTGRFSGAGTSR